MYNPNIKQMTTPLTLKHRVNTTINGAPKISYEGTEQLVCSWKSKGGTEKVEAGTIVIEDTAEVTTWYRPDVNKQDRVLLNCDPNLEYEIINVPENVEMRNQYLIFKVRRVVNG